MFRFCNYVLKRARVLAFGIFVIPLALALHPIPAEAGAVFTVTYADDLGDDNPGDGICDVGVSEVVAYCSLRAAIDEAESLDATASSAATALLPDCRASPSLPVGLFD